MALIILRPSCVPTPRDALKWLNHAESRERVPARPHKQPHIGPEECVPRPSLCKRDAVDGRTRRAATTIEASR